MKVARKNKQTNKQKTKQGTKNKKQNNNKTTKKKNNNKTRTQTKQNKQKPIVSAAILCPVVGVSDVINKARMCGYSISNFLLFFGKEQTSMALP